MPKTTAQKKTAARHGRGRDPRMLTPAEGEAELVARHTAMAQKLAARFAARQVYPLGAGEAFSGAMEGVLEAVRTHDLAREDSYPLYKRCKALACRRMIDAARRSGHASRGEAARRRPPAAALCHDPVDAGDASAQRREALERADLVAWLLECLKPASRLALTLYYLDGLQLGEVARRLGVSISQACRLVKGALRHLRGGRRAVEAARLLAARC